MKTDDLIKLTDRLVDSEEYASDAAVPAVAYPAVDALLRMNGELRTLRVSLARIAQAMNVQTDQVPVTGLNYAHLHTLATEQDRGWNDLAAACVEKVSGIIYSDTPQLMLHNSDDISWAADKFSLGFAPGYFPGSCVLTGNEDAPDRLEFYQQAEPRVTDRPFCVVNFEGWQT
jgi:hypothetical protein